MGGGAFDSYRVCERMARVDIGLGTSVFATFLGSDPILMGGTEEQRKEWLGRIAEQGIVFAYGATEPEAGSDLGAMTTDGGPGGRRRRRQPRLPDHRPQAVDQQRQHRRRLHGPGDGPGRPVAGSSWSAARTGFSSAPPEDKHGIRLSNTAALFLDDVVVPADRPRGRRRGARARPGPAGLRLHPSDGRRVRAGRRLGGDGPGDPVLDPARAGRRAAEREAGLHPQAGRPARRPARGGPRRRRGDRHAGSTRARATMARSTPRARSRSTWPPRPASRRRTRRSRRTAATATPAPTWWRRSAATCGSPPSTKAPPRSWR